MANSGKKFETDIENSAKEQKIFHFRVRDVNLPLDVRMGGKVKIPKNKYDALLYYKDTLLPVELKSVNAKSISLSESMIKAHQLKNLEEASKL